MKKYLLILAVLLTALSSRADITATWRLHMPFDAWPTQVIETPERVYFMSRTFEYSNSLPERNVSSNALYYYDKAGDEIVSINELINANGSAVALINYNHFRKYLLVVYTDCNIDFIYDDGRVFNLPALKAYSIPGKKEVNGITFDNTLGRVYLATSFGYVSLNDARHEVAESRNYGEEVQSYARCGDNYVLCSDNKMYYAPVESQRFNFNDYKEIEGSPAMNVVLPVDNGKFFAYKNKGATDIMLFEYNAGNDTFTWEKAAADNNTFGVQTNPSGYGLSGNTGIITMSTTSALSTISRPEEIWRTAAASYDSRNMWGLVERKGLKGYVKQSDKWVIAHDYMRPNAPATYIASSAVYHPTYGMLVGSNEADFAYSEFSQATPANISALKDGFWKEYGFYYSGNTSFSQLNTYGGLAVDPSNRNHVYRVGTLGGIMRVNLANPSDILIFANPSNVNAGKDGFIKIVDDQAAWNLLCRFTVPQFASDGTMWTLYNNRDEESAELWYWPAADRLATTSAATYRPMKKIKKIPKFPSSNSDVMITLQNNKNMVVMGGFSEGGTVMIYDHKGTPENTSDDRYVFISRPLDQDGGSVDFLSVNNLFEDPSTGLVWILTQKGVFTVNPATAFESPNRVNRIKVARNDGTNLADYLLNEINVNSMSIDGEGRKWFSTSNGLVCTTSDGRTILGEFTADNSDLADNNVYTTCYNPGNNSMIVATGAGIMEMFPSGSGGGNTADGSEIRVYPNPVEPDYYGWVRIDNIPDGSLVKITDSTGGIVKELGPANGGSVEWDVSGYNHQRVTTGVYYVMVSPGANSTGKAQIAKILVLN